MSCFPVIRGGGTIYLVICRSSMFSVTADLEGKKKKKASLGCIVGCDSRLSTQEGGKKKTWEEGYSLFDHLSHRVKAMPSVPPQ